MAPSLGTFDVSLAFDPTILAFNSASFGDPVLGDQLDLAKLGSISSITPGVGSVEVFELSLDTIADLNRLQADTFTLGMLSFNAIATGKSFLDVSVNALGDASGNPLTAAVRAGIINVQGAEIPEPNLSLILFGWAIALSLLSRKSRPH